MRMTSNMLPRDRSDLLLKNAPGIGSDDFGEKRAGEN